MKLVLSFMFVAGASAISWAESAPDTRALPSAADSRSVPLSKEGMAAADVTADNGAAPPNAALTSPFAPGKNSHIDRVLPAAAFRPDVEPVAEIKFGRRSFSIEGRAVVHVGPVLGAGVGETALSLPANGHALFLGTHLAVARETYNYGTWEANASVARIDGDRLDGMTLQSGPLPATGGTILLRNSGFPLTSTLLFDVNAGNIGLDIARQLPGSDRISMSTRSALRGVASAVRSVDGKLDARVGIAGAGTLEGEQFPMFTPSDGRIAWAGFGYRPLTDVRGGMQLIHATRVREDSLYVPGAPGNQPADAVAAATSRGVSTLATGFGYGQYNATPDATSPWAGRVTTLINHVDSAAVGLPSTRWGVFADLRYLHDRFEHTLNAVFATPALIYGDRPLQAPTSSVSWVSSMQKARLSWSAGMDIAQFDRVDKSSRSSRASANGNASWRLGRSEVIFASLAAAVERGHAFDTLAESTPAVTAAQNARRVFVASAGYRFPLAGIGLSAVTASAVRNEAIVANGARASGWQAAWEHDWYLGRFDPSKTQIRTSIGYAVDNSQVESRRYPTASVSLRTPSDRDWMLNASLRYSSSNGNLLLDRGLSASINAQWRIAHGWSTGLSISANEARFDFRSEAVVLLPSRRNERRAMLWLRWDLASGSPYIPLGQQTRGVAGAGAIRGYVRFADEGQPVGEAADRKGAAGVEVWLDRRYRVTTDSTGRYEFPLVPVGLHRIDIAPGSVPLPWELASGGSVTLDIQLRGDAEHHVTLRRIVERD
jgi:hypothetical protein